MSSNALKSFEDLMKSVDQLKAIHAKVQNGRGRRHRQEAIHRAGVVLSVAAWQAYIEKLVLEALSKIETQICVGDGQNQPPAWIVSSFKFRKPSVHQSVGAFNTPNSQNVRQLLDKSFGFDPYHFWIWVTPRRQWSPKDYCERTDAWLRIRHSIAHGNNLPDNISWIKDTKGAPRLNLKLLSDCQSHFRKLAECTDESFSSFLKNEYHIIGF